MIDKTDWVQLGPDLRINAELMEQISDVKIECKPGQGAAVAEVIFAEGLSIGSLIISGKEDMAALLRWLAEAMLSKGAQ